MGHKFGTHRELIILLAVEAVLYLLVKGWCARGGAAALIVVLGQVTAMQNDRHGESFSAYNQVRDGRATDQRGWSADVDYPVERRTAAC